MSRDYRKSGNRVHNLNYHIVFCPKYRRKCLVGDVAKRCEELVREKCAELDADVIALEVMPDHIHLFVAAKPDLAPSYIVNQVKGVSSRRLREEFPHLLKMPSLWMRSWYVGSVGHTSEVRERTSDSVVQAYIENQSSRARATQGK